MSKQNVGFSKDGCKNIQSFMECSKHFGANSSTTMLKDSNGLGLDSYKSRP